METKTKAFRGLYQSGRVDVDSEIADSASSGRLVIPGYDTKWLDVP